MCLCPGASPGHRDFRALTVEVCRLHAIVRGTVQGVGFRAHTQWEAARLGLSGYARNLRDGGVEVVAEGSREALERLERFLRVGPPGARVSRLEVKWAPAENGLQGFGIRF